MPITKTINSVKSNDVFRLLDKEWLLTNRRGGFACGTLACCNVRRYHSLLVGALNPPANRIMALSCLEDKVIIAGREYLLSNFEFNETPLNENALLPDTFSQDVGVSFEYNLGPVKIVKKIYLASQDDRIAIAYEFSELTAELDLVIRPFVAVRDYHSLLKSSARFCTHWEDSELVISNDMAGSSELRMYGGGAAFVADNDWWYNFYYRLDDQRGQGCLEDLWTPGCFEYHIDSPGEVVLWAGLCDSETEDNLSDLDIDILRDDLQLEQKNVLKAVRKNDEIRRSLYLAADKFIADRTVWSKQTSTILAGFPWFLDWGRDSFISLKGLLLETGQFEKAKQVLCTFASAVDQGMIPNRFDDYSDAVHYNSIDASLWFVNSAFEYLEATSDKQTFASELLGVIKWIVEGYYNGTRFGICADADGLIMGGSEETQLTWMDAKCNDIAFTPRHGKAVEINALWHNAICCLAEYYKARDKSAELYKHYAEMADEIEDSFRKVFWNEHCGCLYDCVLPDGRADDSIRPNQIFAVSLKYSPLNQQEQEKVVDVVADELLTPYGLRSLSSYDSNYKGRCVGSMMERDSAYHQGTVWAWLMGPFVKAYLRVNNYSSFSKSQAMDMIKSLLNHLAEDGCLGSVSEIFDGDPPHKPRGCFAQAWSVAQLIEAYNLLNV